MIIGGLQKFSLLDYPDAVSAIVFTQGCNFRCQFCYNPMLVWPIAGEAIKDTPRGEEGKGHPFINPVNAGIKEGDLFLFLEKRVGKLEGIVISGGEPTLHHDLPEFIEKIKKLGFKIKLDTNGTNPEMVEKLIAQNLLDYIAMDIKAPLEKYKKVTGVDIDFKKIEKSVKIIMQSGVPYQFRTTLVPGLAEKDDIKAMGELIKGADAWYLQKFKADTELVEKKLVGKSSFTDSEMEEMREIGAEYVRECGVR